MNIKVGLIGAGILSVLLLQACKYRVTGKSSLKLGTAADTTTGIDDDATLQINWDFITSGRMKDPGSNLEFFISLYVCVGETTSKCEKVAFTHGGSGMGVFFSDKSSRSFVVPQNESYSANPNIIVQTLGRNINAAASSLPRTDKGKYWLAVKLFEKDSFLVGGSEIVGWNWSYLSSLHAGSRMVIENEQTKARATVAIDARDGIVGKTKIDFGAVNFNFIPIDQMRALHAQGVLCAVPEKGENACYPDFVPVTGSTPDFGIFAFVMPFGNYWIVFAPDTAKGTGVPFYRAVGQTPMTVTPRAAAENFVFDKKQLDQDLARAAALSVMLYVLPGGAATDHFSQSGLYSGEAWTSAAGDLGMVLTGGGSRALKIIGMALESGVVTVRGYQVVKAANDRDWVRAAAGTAEVVLRLGNVAGTVRALRAGLPLEKVRLTALSQTADSVVPHTMTTSSGGTIQFAGAPGPGISDDILEASQKLANESKHPIVLLGSRQTGVSPKTGLPFRPDSDVDLGVLKAEHLLGDIVDPEYVNRFHKLFQHGPTAVFDSVDDAIGKGYLVVYPR